MLAHSSISFRCKFVLHIFTIQFSRYKVENFASRNIRFTKFVVGLGGLEPPTSRLSGVRSNHLSYKPRKTLSNS